jgi:hypothetical protein
MESVHYWEFAEGLPGNCRRVNLWQSKVPVHRYVSIKIHCVEGGQTAFAKCHGVDRVPVNMILNGKRPVSDAIAKALGLRKVCVAE